MKKDLEEKVAVTLARFDKAVKNSSTRRRSDPTGQQQEPTTEPDLDLDLDVDLNLAQRISPEAEGEEPADKPRCRPWDYKGFIARQRTFTPLKWFSKPALASPPVCARYGWINTARDTLSCQCCGAQLRFSEGNQASNGSSGGGGGGAGGNAADDGHGDATHSAGADAGGETQAVSGASFSSRLKSHHHDLCPWKGNACPKEFLQLPPTAPEDLLAEFASRLQSLEPFIAASSLPEVRLPSSFEEHCPGGLSNLAAKTRTVLAQHASSFASSSSSSTPAAAVQAAVGGCHSENGGSRPGGRNRQRDGGGGGGGGVCADNGGFLACMDEVLGTAAAIALFGWGSANAAAATASSSAVEGSSNGVAAGAAGGDGGASARSPTTAPYRLCCALCNRRLATDNFLTIDLGPRLDANAGIAASQPAAAAAAAAAATATVTCPASDGDGDGGSSRRGKRRRLSGGGTPLTAMDLATEHRSFCPWAAVHPQEDGEDVTEGAVPGWRQPLEALLAVADPAEQVSSSSKPEEAEGFGDMATGGKAEETLPKVQKVLGVLMRY